MYLKSGLDIFVCFDKSLIFVQFAITKVNTKYSRALRERQAVYFPKRSASLFLTFYYFETPF